MQTPSARSVTAAAEQLRALLALPDARPGCWEAEHIEALEDELRGLLALLEAAEK